MYKTRTEDQKPFLTSSQKLNLDKRDPFDPEHSISEIDIVYESWFKAFYFEEILSHIERILYKVRNINEYMIQFTFLESEICLLEHFQYIFSMILLILHYFLQYIGKKLL